jgi:hypothetical protein
LAIIVKGVQKVNCLHLLSITQLSGTMDIRDVPQVT